MVRAIALLTTVLLVPHFAYAQAASTCGDCDGNGQVSIADALRAAIFATGLAEPTSIESAVCDVNGSYDITVVDALLLAQSLVGLPITIACLPVRNWELVRKADIEPRVSHAMAYDPQRGGVLLFGGEGEYWRNNTWLWNGSDWRELSVAPISIPYSSAVSHPSMTYDTARGVSVLICGGYSVDQIHAELDASGWTRLPPPPFSSRNDIWEWDGVVWSFVNAPTPRPQARSGASMIYDPIRQVLVLAGGFQSAGAGLQDLWEWDGMVWRQGPPIPLLVDPTLAWDQSRGVALLLGYNGGVIQSWTWDGVSFAQLAPTTIPPGLIKYAVALDSARNRVVLSGGERLNSHLGETWEWDGADWILAAAPKTPPFSDDAHAVERPGRGVMLFGGVTNCGEGDVWNWDAPDWTRIVPSPEAPQIRNGAAAYDSVRQVVVRFSGSPEYGSIHTADTWEWDGASWQQMSPVLSPGPRFGAAMTYEVARNCVVLFGGRNLFVDLEDTWSYASGEWNQMFPATSPMGRYDHAMVYDARRGVSVMVGGMHYTFELIADTWEWDGQDWTERHSPIEPPALSEHAMAYDSNRSTTLLFGGNRSFSRGISEQTWEWNGSTWRQLITENSPPALVRHTMAYDSLRNSIVLYSGTTPDSFSPSSLRDLWELR